MLRVQRHELHKANFKIVFTAEANEGNDVRLSQPFDRNGVEFDDVVPDFPRSFQTCHDALEIVTPRDLPKAFAIKSIEMNV